MMYGGLMNEAYRALTIARGAVRSASRGEADGMLLNSVKEITDALYDLSTRIDKVRAIAESDSITREALLAAITE